MSTITAGARVNRWRRHKGLTIRDLAKLAGIHKSRVQRIEAGVSEPKASELDQFADAFGVTLLRFLGHLPAEKVETEKAA